MPDNSENERIVQNFERFSCWVVTEGMAGTENQCLGVAEALGLVPEVKRIKLRTPWKQLTPYLRIANRLALSPEGDLLAPPWPDIVLASGRKSVAASLAIKKASGGKTFTVQIQDPRCNPALFDLVIVPQHDPTRGDNVIVTTGALHRVTPEKLATEKQKFPALNDLPRPRVAVLIGGTSKSHTLTPTIMGDVAELLENLAREHNAGLMVTASRRTGIDNEAILRARLSGVAASTWDGAGDNPYFAYLAQADYIVVTADSVSMVSEAVSTGKPVYIVDLEGGARRFDRFHRLLQEQGYTRPFAGKLEKWDYIPTRDTQRVAEEIKNRFKEHTQRYEEKHARKRA